MWQIRDTNYIFFHVPKNAGTAIKKGLASYSRGIGITGNHSLDRLERAIFRSFGINTPLCYLSPVKRLIRRDCITEGHISVGDVLRENAELLSEKIILAVVREPLERVISYFFYVKGKPTHYRHQELVGLSLPEFIEHEVEKYQGLREGDQYQFLRADLPLRRHILFQERLSHEFEIFAQKNIPMWNGQLTIQNKSVKSRIRDLPSCIEVLIDRDRQLIAEIKNDRKNNRSNLYISQHVADMG